MEHRKVYGFVVFLTVILFLMIGSVSAADTPSANFTSNTTNGTGPLIVQFNDTSTGDPTSWLWDFGDGNNSTLQNATHTYTDEGTYNVSLTAINAIGNTTLTKNDYITVAIPPTVTASLTGGIYNTTQTVTLTSDDPTATIYYANDTTDPRTSSTRIEYTGPINIDTTTTLRYAAVDTYGNWSPLYLQNYVIGTGGLNDSAWPDFGGDNNNTGQSTYTGPQNNFTIWTYDTGDGIDYSQAVIGSDGTIYIGSTDKNLYAINPDGTLKWNYTTGGSISGSAVIGSDGTIYVASNDAKLYAINPDGTLNWTYTLGKVSYGSPAIGADGTIYIGSYDKNLYAINPDGTLKWTYTTGGYIYQAQPAVGSDGTIYVGTRDCNLYAINPDGTLKWKFTTGGYIYGSSAIGADGTIYVGSRDGSLYAINPDGTLKWAYTTDNGIYASPAIGADGTIYIGSNDKNLYAINPDGTLKWAYTTEGLIYSTPLIDANGTIYVGCRDNKLYAINANGTLKWTYNTEGTISSSASISANETLYIGSDDGRLYAFKDLPPVASFTADVTTGGVPITVHFTDESLYATSWAWDFDSDGIIDSTEQNPTYIYTTPGDYTVSLTIYNYLGNSTTTKSIELSILPPVVNFTTDVTSGTSPLTVKFTDESLYVTSWAWDFDNDGIIDSTEQNPTYTYTKAPGYYTVSLTVTGPGGSNTTIKTDYIQILPSVTTSVTGGSYTTAQTVTLTCDDPTATIYYTNDTTDPRNSTTRIQYTEPFTLDSTNTVRYAAITGTGLWSPLYIQNYVIGTGGLLDSPSSTYQINNNHTGQSEYEGPQSNATKWNITDMTFFQDSSVVIGSDGIIYAGSYSGGYLYAIYPTGIVKWVYYTGGSDSVTTPTIGADGTIYIAANDYVHALNTNGTVIWKYYVGDINSIITLSIGTDGTIYIGSSDGGIFYAIYPNGTQKWNTTLFSTSIGSTAAIASDGTIYVADNDDLYAINQDGTIQWFYSMPDHQFSAPSIGNDGTIYIGEATVLHAINPDGTLKWTYSIGSRMFGAAAIASDGTLYLGCIDGTLYALNEDGTLKWKYTTGKSSYSSPLIGADGIIYFSTQGGLFAINPDGTLNWSDTSFSSNCNMILDSDGSLYIGTNKGLYTFGTVVANFGYTVDDVNPLKVDFNNTSNDSTSWSWDFGDGTTSTEENPTHNYSKSGDYIATLTITLTNGDTATVPKKITVSDVTAPEVNVDIGGGIFDTAQTITLDTTDDSGTAIIYYTTDGTDPRTSSTRITYTAPITLSDTTTFRYAAVDLSGNWSPLYTETYTINLATPASNIFVQNASYYSGSLNDQIQAILDDAAPGSTIEFLGQLYENLQLTINKNLNIISNVGTKISASNTAGSAVFTINGSQASGTTISGFIISDTGAGSGILVNGTNNTTISNVQVSATSGNAVSVNNSSNTNIENSLITDSENGISVTGSNGTQIDDNEITNNVNNGISIEGSDNTTITWNTLKNNGNTAEGSGIYLGNSTNITVNNNQINENWYGINANNITNVTISTNSILNNERDGILLSGNATNTTIMSNTIQENDNGIHVNGASENLTIKSNLITGSTRKASSYRMYRGNGVLYGTDYVHSDTILIEHNVIRDNENMDFRSCMAAGYYVPGSNWYGSSCKQVTYDPQMTMSLVRTGENAFSVLFYDGNTGEIVTDLPSILVTFINGATSQSVMTTNGIATAVFNNLAEGDVIGISYDVVVSAAYSSAITYLAGSDTGGSETGGNDNNNGDDSGNGLGTGTGTGTGTGSGTGTGTGVSSVSGISSGSASTVGATAALSAAGSSGSSGQDGGENSETAQELIVDDLTEDANVWAIVGVILLIILVLGAYYRKDIMNMIKKSKK